MRRTAHVSWQKRKLSLMEMTGSFVISTAANIINPALPCRSAGGSVQSICHCWSVQALRDRHITASVFTTTITQDSLTTHASNMCGCVSIDLYVSGLNFWTWLWAANFLLGIIMEIALCVAAHTVCQQSRLLALAHSAHGNHTERNKGEEGKSNVTMFLELSLSHLYGSTFR